MVACTAIKYLLDTHTFVWATLDRPRLSAKARRLIETTGPGGIGISAAVVIELGYLIHLDAIEFDGRPSDVFAGPLANTPQIPISLSIALAAPALGLPHKDPYDRLIVATARELGVPLITKDGNITNSGLVRVVW